MLTRAKIEAASLTLDEIDVANLVTIIRTSDRYKSNPAYFIDVQSKIEDLDGTTQAKQLNAVLDEIEALGSGVVEINQAQTVGTDGVVYSKKAERDALIDYALDVMYEEFYFTVSDVSVVDGSAMSVLRGNYGVGRLPLEYEGYL